MNFNTEDFPKHKKSGRVELAINWLSKGITRLLDGGCSYGYCTVYFKEVANEVYGLEIESEMVEIARSLFSNIEFVNSNLENTGFDANFFDAVVLNDSLEHTNDDLATLNEVFRILNDGGELIISVPNKGLFGFLDPYNYGYYLKKIFPSFYLFIKKMKYKIKGIKNPNLDINLTKHRHYSLKDLNKLLEKSLFKSNYQITNVFRGGLLIEPLVLNLEVFLLYFLKQKTANKITIPLKKITDWEYKLNFGCLAYNLAIKVKKK